MDCHFIMQLRWFWLQNGAWGGVRKVAISPKPATESTFKGKYHKGRIMTFSPLHMNETILALFFCSDHILLSAVWTFDMSWESEMSFSSDSEPLFYWSSSGIYGPDEGWALAYPECREKNQSPVNILDQDTKVSTEYQELTLEGFDNESSNKTSMKNTGKTGENYSNIPACFCPTTESRDNTGDFVHSHIYIHGFDPYFSNSMLGWEHLVAFHLPTRPSYQS